MVTLAVSLYSNLRDNLSDNSHQISFLIQVIINEKTIHKTDEPRYCNNNTTTSRATNFTYQLGVRTNLEVTVLYAQVEVKVLPVVTIHPERDPRGSKSNFYRVRRSLILRWKKRKSILRELLYCINEENNM